MASKRKTGSAKKFGPRYGRTLKEKYGTIDSLQKKKYICPVCSYKNVKRVNLGIWQCEKCNAKFASKAYTVPRVSVRKEEPKQDQIDIALEEVEAKKEVLENDWIQMLSM